MSIKCEKCNGEVIENIKEQKQYIVPTHIGPKEIQVSRVFNICSTCGNTYTTYTQKRINATLLVNCAKTVKQTSTNG